MPINHQTPELTMRVDIILLSLSLPLCMHAQAQVLLPGQTPDPAFANLVFWMDAADPATITFGAGTSVSAWLDKAGGRSLTPISGTSIALGTGSHGMPTVNFTGATGMQFSDLVVPVNDADGDRKSVV
jgi:hypothetical protein